MDSIAETLNKRRPWFMAERVNGIPISLSHLGKGGFAHIYKLCTPTANYILKVFRPKEEVDRKMRMGMAMNALTSLQIPSGDDVEEAIYTAQFDNNPFRESAVGLFLKDKPVWDVARYHVGNPLKGWHISEFIDKTVDLKSRKAEKPYTLNQVGFKFTDDPGTLGRILSINGLLGFFPALSHVNNRIRGIRVDYGAMEGQYRPPKKCLVSGTTA
jgi:hypothetical protein